MASQMLINTYKEKVASEIFKLSNALEKNCTNYENIVLLGDFNVEAEEKNMSEFISVYNLVKLVL